MDPITMILERAWELHKNGQLSEEDLVKTMKRCVNVRAIENGYDEQFGMPLPEELPW